MDEASTRRHLAEIDEQGFTIVRDAIDPALVTELRDAIREVEKQQGSAPRGNPAEGFATLRNYNLLEKHPSLHKMPIHDEILPIVEGVLEPGCLLSGMTAIDIGPGEKPQPLHPDDIVMDIARPHEALMCVAMWALTDFSAENGATRYIPGTHKADHAPDYSQEYETQAAEMPAGSVMIFHGSLWHGGGPNTSSDQWRLGVNVQYCRGWIRTQQNHYLGVTPETVQTMPDRLLELLGMNLYKGIMGHVDGASPGAVIGEQRAVETAYTGERMRTSFTK